MKNTQKNSSGPPLKPGADEKGSVLPSVPVTLVAVINYLVGCLSFFCGGAIIYVVVFTAGTMLGAAAKDTPNVDSDTAVVMGLVGIVAIVAGSMIMILGLPMIIAGIAVTKRAQWGRVLTIVLGVISGVLAVLSLLQLNLIAVVIYSFYSVTVLVVLLNPRYAAEFR